MVKDGRLETVLDGYMPAMPKLRAFVDHMRRALADYIRARNGEA